MCLIVTCIFVRGRGKRVLRWKLLIGFISITTKHIIYIVTSQPDTQKGHIWLYIIVIMIFLISITIDNFMTMTSSPVFFRLPYICPHYFTALYLFPPLLPLSSHWLLNNVQCISRWFKIWFRLRLGINVLIFLLQFKQSVSYHWQKFWWDSD
jgi:hypothetical protein